MSDEAQQKRFKSILDYNPPFQSVLKTIGSEIELSISSLQSSGIIKTYFNMISVEYYNYEYDQLLKMNDLKLKDDKTGVLNLTILELIYNIIYQIVQRRWKYSNHASYDIYILPIRIKKYLNALNYDFKKYIISKNKEVFRLVPSPSKHVSILINKYTYSNSISAIFEKYKLVDNSDIESRMIYFRKLTDFLKYSWPIANKTFGEQFTMKIKNEVELIKKLEIKNLKKSEIKFINKTTDKIVNVAMMIFLLMLDNMELGIWDDIVNKQKADQKRKDAEKMLMNVNHELKILEEREKEFEENLFTIEPNSRFIFRKIKQPNINLNLFNKDYD